MMAALSLHLTAVRTGAGSVLGCLPGPQRCIRGGARASWLLPPVDSIPRGLRTHSNVAARRGGLTTAAEDGPVASFVDHPTDFQVGEPEAIIEGAEDDYAVLETDKDESWLSLEKFVALSAAFLSAGGTASAKEYVTRFSPEEWINIYWASGVWVVLYFLVIPIVIYNYLRLRWYMRSMPETYFQFMLVFVFFPGMLLLAPFINFRPLPKDGVDGP